MSHSIDWAVVISVGVSAHQSQLSYNRPRAMLPALGKPLIVRVMDRLYQAGIRRYIVVVGEDEGAVAAYLSEHWLPNVTIEFVIQSTTAPLNHILQNIAATNQPPCLVTSYNSFTHPNFADRLLSQGVEHVNSLVLGGAEVSLSQSQPHAVGLIEDNQLTHIELRPSAMHHTYVCLTDLALCGQMFFDDLKDAKPERELMPLFHNYIRAGQPAHVVRAGWTLNVQTDEDLLTLNRHLLDEEQDANLLSEFPASVQIIPPVRIDPQVSIGQEARIGPYVYLESGCSIGHHAIIRNALILRKANVPSNSTVEDTILSSRSRISP